MSSTSPPTATARARPSPGICCRPSSPACRSGRMVFHEITGARHPGRGREPPRSGHRPGRRPGDPAHPRPAVRLRGQPGAVEEGGPKLSAGRVQSVATRIIVQRERNGWPSAARRTWDVLAELDASVSDATATRRGSSRLVAVDGKAGGHRPRLRLPGRAAQARRGDRARRGGRRSWPQACRAYLADRRVGRGEDTRRPYRRS